MFCSIKPSISARFAGAGIFFIRVNYEGAAESSAVFDVCKCHRPRIAMRCSSRWSRSPRCELQCSWPTGSLFLKRRNVTRVGLATPPASRAREILFSPATRRAACRHDVSVRGGTGVTCRSGALKRRRRSTASSRLIVRLARLACCRSLWSAHVT